MQKYKDFPIWQNLFFSLPPAADQLGGEAEQKEDAEEERQHLADVDGPPDAVDAHQGGKRPDGGHFEDQRVRECRHTRQAIEKRDCLVTVPFVFI